MLVTSSPPLSSPAANLLVQGWEPGPGAVLPRPRATGKATGPALHMRRVSSSRGHRVLQARRRLRPGLAGLEQASLH